MTQNQKGRRAVKDLEKMLANKDSRLKFAADVARLNELVATVRSDDPVFNTAVEVEEQKIRNGTHA